MSQEIDPNETFVYLGEKLLGVPRVSGESIEAYLERLRANLERTQPLSSAAQILAQTGNTYGMTEDMLERAAHNVLEQFDEIQDLQAARVKALGILQAAFSGSATTDPPNQEPGA